MSLNLSNEKTIVMSKFMYEMVSMRFAQGYQLSYFARQHELGAWESPFGKLDLILVDILNIVQSYQGDDLLEHGKIR